MFELMDSYSQNAVIRVIGVGGGGGNAVAHMVKSGIEGVDFICANTDAQALKTAKVKTALQIGCNDVRTRDPFSACESVLAQMKSTPSIPVSTICPTAFPPPPPTPMTLMTALWLCASISSNIEYSSAYFPCGALT